MANVFSEAFPIVASDYACAGEASAKIKSLLKMIGIDPALIRRVTIAAYEAEMNMIIHSKGGMMTLEISPDTIYLACDDTGPGISDIDKAMQEGFSTAPSNIRMMGFGAGMGLPNIKRNSDTFDIRSCQDGTCLKLKFNINQKGDRP
ncbi:MAG: ATP-binding protein [Eubacteriales bacterium]|nr:ATP-binding protein [Eubacteriales bacterium]